MFFIGIFFLENHDHLQKMLFSKASKPNPNNTKARKHFLLSNKNAVLYLFDINVIHYPTNQYLNVTRYLCFYFSNLEMSFMVALNMSLKCYNTYYKIILDIIFIEKFDN